MRLRARVKVRLRVRARVRVRVGVRVRPREAQRLLCGERGVVGHDLHLLIGTEEARHVVGGHL